MSIKISIIDAGRVIFCVNLIKDICLTPNLEKNTISLMDIDKNRLVKRTICALDMLNKLELS